MMTLEDGVLAENGTPVLTGLPPEMTLECAEGGAFLQCPFENRASDGVFPLGRLEKVERYAACVRFPVKPWWTHPAAGTAAEPLPPLTYWAVYQHAAPSGTTPALTLLIPLPTENEAVTLQAPARADEPELLAETGSARLQLQGGRCLFVAHGTDLDAMLAQAAAAVSKVLPGARLRTEKPVPPFMDGFSWCTWNAFYQDVNADKVMAGLQSFEDAKAPMPRTLILDDGWLDLEFLAKGGAVLRGFEADAQKFPGGLKAFTERVRSRFPIGDILVWHTVDGYWKGISPTSPSMQPYAPVRTTVRGDYAMRSTGLVWGVGWCDQVSLPAIDRYHDFYFDFHRFLREQGITGAKVDNQASFLFQSDNYAEGKGRTHHAAAFRQALSESARDNFNGNLISCMGNAQELLYHAPYDNLTRSSDDFFPDIPASHAAHLRANAFLGLWFGAFNWMDWDMFESGHPYGPYHAAGRVLSGGPVYVTDRPGTHNVALLRKLVFADGTIARCDAPGRPAFANLFERPEKTHAPTVLVNTFLQGQVGLVGVFQSMPGASAEAAFRAALRDVRGSVLPGAAGHRSGAWAAWLHNAKTLRVLADGGARLDVAAGDACPECPLAFEVVTFAPVYGKLAILGIEEMFNAASPVTAVTAAYGALCADFRAGGTLVVYAADKPADVRFSGEPLPFEYDPATGRITATLPGAGRLEVRA